MWIWRGVWEWGEDPFLKRIVFQFDATQYILNGFKTGLFKDLYV